MSQTFQGWDAVAEKLEQRVRACRESHKPNAGQRATLMALATRLQEGGVLLADEVGLGKTLIAAEVIRAVTSCGGRVAIMIPTGLGPQWQDELRHVGIQLPEALRGLKVFHAPLHNSNRNFWKREPVLVMTHTFMNYLTIDSKSKLQNYDVLAAMYAKWQTKDCAAQCPRKQRLQTGVEQCMSMALGRFDLIVIDEAHKSRGKKSGLSRCLTTLLRRSEQCRVLGMTATPVELNSTQWGEILQRIGLDAKRALSAAKASKKYVQSVKKLRTGVWKYDTEAVDAFVCAAQKYTQELAPWVLRRTKAEDSDVQLYQELTQCQNTYDYHIVHKIEISLAQLDEKWQKALCAAEGLSLAARGLDHHGAKRVRLGFGSGHSIAKLLDKIHETEEDQDDEDHDEADGDEADGDAATEANSTQAASTVKAKQEERVLWWQEALRETLGKRVLFSHPALQAAVQRIEAITSKGGKGDKGGKGEKVLVFGTYIKPLKTLEKLLNARYLLRCFEHKTYIPLEQIPAKLKKALSFTLRQQKKSGTTVEMVSAWLREQYKKRETQRKTFREALPKTVVRSSFARMLRGRTKHESRRTAQLAFNHEHSQLRVLIAQSRVGREGLNLHEACRHVLLLHPEWNPGVVEQQIGRVDRVGSYWGKLLRAYAKDPSLPCPHIETHCIVFKGTYDEHHWQVLEQRRIALRAQFHGEILPLEMEAHLSEEEKAALAKIKSNTPSFSPPHTV